MKVVFLGTGEAFDENTPNNSHLIITKKTKLLLDCGYTAPFQLWKYNPEQNFLDAIYISHAHADHYFGLTALFMRMWEEKRKREISVICRKGFKKTFKIVMEYAYPGFSKKFNFKIKFMEVREGQSVKFKDLKLSFADTLHSHKNLAIKMNVGKKSVCYSGDGMFDKNTEKLYGNSDLLIHEAYLYDEKKIGHACVVDLVEMAKRKNIKCLALAHLQRDFRKNESKKLHSLVSKKAPKIIIPRPFDEYEL